MTLASAGVSLAQQVAAPDAQPSVIADFCSVDPFGQIVAGYVDSITIDDPFDPFSGGTMVVAGTEVIIPANLVITLPANWQTLGQLYENAPPPCVAVGQTGLAIEDTCLNGALGGFATILANRVRDYRLIAGDVDLAKNPDAVSGPISYINYDQGYFEVGGVVGLAGSGVRVRSNDPDSIHTIQSGVECYPGAPNCSPDVRYTNDPDNYTQVFVTGYPLCIPSTQTDGALRTTAANASGVGDPFCPQATRPADPTNTAVPDSRFYAPIKLGDTVVADGNFEDINGVHFLSAHTVVVNVALVTAPNQPDYMIFDEVEMDVPGFANARSRMLLIGFTTDLQSQLDIYGLHKDPSDPDGADNFVPLASTIGNPDTICQGVGGAPGTACAREQGGGIFKIRYDVDFIAGTSPLLSPCTNLFNAGLRASPVCSLGEELNVMVPAPMEIQAFTLNGQLLKAAGVTNHNIRGESHTYGQYLNPNGIGHPEFVEINLGLTDFPFIFSGTAWNLDRRHRVGGCIGPCESLATAPLGTLGLNPNPWAEYDPRLLSSAPTGCTIGVDCALPAGSEDRMFMHYDRVVQHTCVALTCDEPAGQVCAVDADCVTGLGTFDTVNLVPWPPLASSLPATTVTCDDNNPCTDDSCNSASGCVFAANALICDDGNACTSGDTCVAGVCAGAPTSTCDDGNPCTDDVCNPTSGLCLGTPNDLNVCDDADICTDLDACIAGVCGGTRLQGCDCADIALVPLLAGPVIAPTSGSPLQLDVTIDSGPISLGAYAFDLSWNPLAMTLDPVGGGTTAAFSTPPTCNIDNVLGTASCTSFDATGASGVVNVARLTFNVTGLIAPEAVIVTAGPLFDTGTNALAACTPSFTQVIAVACGDVNQSDTLTITDALRIAQFQVGLVDCTGLLNFSLCDALPDGQCSIGDALVIAQCSVGLNSCEFTCSGTLPVCAP